MGQGGSGSIVNVTSLPGSPPMVTFTGSSTVVPGMALSAAARSSTDDPLTGAPSPAHGSVATVPMRGKLIHAKSGPSGALPVLIPVSMDSPAERHRADGGTNENGTPLRVAR